jgi:hypothetical protein
MPPGGYGPPGGAPPGGYGPPGGAPPGGYGPPGGAPPGGYGPPPGGGYGPPPGAGGYGPPGGAPPGSDFGAPPGAIAPIGQRAQFVGDGGKLLATFLLWGIAPLVVGMIAFGTFNAIGMAIDGPTHGKHAHGPGAIAYLFMLIGLIIYVSLAFVGQLIFANKFIGFRFDNLVLDGQRCEYKGTVGQFFMVHLINALLIAVTFGIYTPWAFCRLYRFMYENTTVNGQPGRLTFTGDGGELLGKYILGMILTICTFYIYGAWFVNDLFAFFWENTKLDGRGFGFRKDPGGFLGTYILTMILTMCTAGIYYPWGICNILKWEAERVA